MALVVVLLLVQASELVSQDHHDRVMTAEQAVHTLEAVVVVQAQLVGLAQRSRQNEVGSAE